MPGLPFDHEDNIYGPNNDFFRMWRKDEFGRNCLVGLTFEETKEYSHFVDTWLANRMAGKRRTEKESRRYFELQERHERARLERLADPKDQAIRLAEFLSRNRE